MRLADLVRPYVEGRDRIVDATPTTFDLRADLFLTTPASYVRMDPAAAVDASFGDDSVVLVMAGPDPDLHGDPDAATTILGRLGPSGRAVLLLAWGPVELPYRRLLPALAANGCQVRRIAGLDPSDIPSAAIVERVTGLVPLLDEAGRQLVGPPADDAARLELEIRLVNELAFGDFTDRALRLAAAPIDSLRGQERSALERRRLQRRMEAAEVTIEQLEAKIAALEGSTSLEVGRVVVGATRSPKAAVRLPIDLVRAWRRR